MTPPFIMKHDHDFKYLTTPKDSSLRTQFFEGSDAKMVVCPMLHRRDDDMYYGEHRLPTHHLSTTRLYDVSQTNLAYVDDDGHLVVINYSKFIDQIPSRSDFINIEYDCRKEWLKTLELSREAFSRGAFWPHYMGSPSDTNNWKIPIALLKQFGSPENILSMIEEGDQGAPLRDRVRAIRENERFMQALKGKWNESNEWNEWGVYRGYRPWGKSGNEICVLDR
ncbi:hypothetical protein CPB86DRAFT_784709 [Serendipita vermifera]|nr:hypothetical protein CPB86DRAFT_784709 [Serendipita vermifera]